MSGIFGIISKSSPIEKSLLPVTEKIFSEFGRTEKHCHHINDEKMVVCMANLTNNKFLIEDKEVKFFIEGEIIIKKDVFNRLSEKHNYESILNHNQYLPVLYNNFGKDFINQIKGVYNILVIDINKNEVLICNDFLGLKPLYYYESDRYFIFSSELRHFFHFSFIDREINKITLIEYILFNIPLGENTFLKKVKLLKPASSILIKDYRTIITNYFDHHTLYSSELYSEKQSLVMLEESFKETVNLCIPEDNKFYLSVTGGFDGRTILSVVNNYKDLMTYTFGAEESSDIEVAREIAAKMKVQHQVYLIEDDYYKDHFFSCADELIMKTDALSTFERSHYLYAFREIGKNSDIVLSGNGGSEIFRVFYRAGALISQLFLELLLQTGDFRYVLLQYLNKSPIRMFINNFNNV